MDRSFLSNPAVIRASRNFVCIRLATYENAEEAVVLKSIFAGRNNNLENTVFAILGPDGKHRLTQTGRSAGWAFGESEEAPAIMGQTMERLARRYARKGAKYQAKLALPTHANFGLALNVAACDSRPLIVGFHPNKSGLEKLAGQLRDVAWDKEFAGRCEYVLVTDPEELKPVRSLGEKPAPGTYVIRPGIFGEFGRVLGAIPAAAKPDELLAQVKIADSKFKAAVKREQRDHTRLGAQMGVHWKTAIPVTDSRSERSQSGRRRDPDSRRRR